MCLYHASIVQRSECFKSKQTICRAHLFVWNIKCLIIFQEFLSFAPINSLNKNCIQTFIEFICDLILCVRGFMFGIALQYYVINHIRMSINYSCLFSIHSITIQMLLNQIKSPNRATSTDSIKMKQQRNFHCCDFQVNNTWHIESVCHSCQKETNN